MAGQTKNYNDRLEEFTEERFRKDYNTCKYSSILLFDTRGWLFDTYYYFREFHSRASVLLNRTNTDNDKSNLEFFIAEVDNRQYHSFHVSSR